MIPKRNAPDKAGRRDKRKNKMPTASSGTQATYAQYTSKAWDFVNKHPDAFIGRLVWFVIGGQVKYTNGLRGGQRSTVPVSVERNKLEDWFNELNLDTSYLPPAPLKINAFRRASTDVHGKYEYALDADQIATLEVVEIDANSEMIVRHLRRRSRNRRTEVLTDAHVATLRFYRGGRTSQGKRPSAEHVKTEIHQVMKEYGLDGRRTDNVYQMTPLDLQNVENAIADFRARYNAYTDYLHTDMLRAVVRNYLVGRAGGAGSRLPGLNAICVKPSGGVYFVHQSRRETVDALQELVGRLGPGCQLHQLPLIDTLDQRQMLTDAFEAEVVDDIRLLLGAIGEVNERAAKQNRGINAQTYGELYARYTELQQRTQEYTGKLGLAQDRADKALELGQDTLLEMSGRIARQDSVKGGTQ